jgi:hypothetical protein
MVFSFAFLWRKENRMKSYIFESNEYELVKNKFESSSRTGYNHIAMWIVSLDFFNEYHKDKVKVGGRRLLINPLREEFTLIPRIKYTILGYDIVVCEGFNEKYGINFIMFKGVDEVNESLLAKNVSESVSL